MLRNQLIVWLLSNPNIKYHIKSIQGLFYHSIFRINIDLLCFREPFNCCCRVESECVWILINTIGWCSCLLLWVSIVNKLNNPLLKPNGLWEFKLYSPWLLKGSAYGLKLTLNIEQYEYMKGPNNAAGVKV